MSVDIDEVNRKERLKENARKYRKLRLDKGMKRAELWFYPELETKIRRYIDNRNTDYEKENKK